MITPSSPVPERDGHRHPDTYHVGTLTYTKMGLAWLFLWLLWGDFCYMVMEAVTPSIIPFKMMALHASNTEMAVLTGSIPTAVYMILNPIISFKSDRFRSRWGRRIPFIVATLPCLMLCLFSLGFSDPITVWAHHLLGPLVAKIPPEQFGLYSLCALLVVFTFFNTFLATVFWYLFNDVVPELLLARFMSLFRVISMVAQAIYNFSIFRYADTHATAIFVGAGLLYFFGFALMCIFVREGKYPPPPANADGGEGAISAVKTFVVECHGSQHYWYQWLINVLGSFGGVLGSIGNGVLSTFSIAYYLAIGLTVPQMGELAGTVQIVTGILIVGSGWLADRYHPIRVVIAGSVLTVFVVTPFHLIWFFWHPNSDTTFWFNIIMGVLLLAPVNALNGVYDPPLLMRLFPRSRYGQFCANNAIWRNLGGVVGPLVAGSFLDYMTTVVGKERAYLFIPLWQMAWGIPAFYMLLRLYRSWKAHGGDDNYVPPLIGAATPTAAIPAEAV